MAMIYSKNALPEQGALYVTISFKVFEIKNKTFVSDGNSYFYDNVRAHRKRMLSGAIYNAIKREFTNRTVTAYDIIIIEYHYTYYLDNYKIKRENGKYYESYTDFASKKRKKYLMDKNEIKNNYVGDYKNEREN